MKPLAYLMRPESFKDIVGQDQLVGENGIITKMIEQQKISSFILYGNAGCGKTTIAEATCKLSKLPTHKFNASTDNKEALKQIVNDARFNDQTIIIVDEIHRMKKDIQDFLLPYLENGMLTMIGLTTVNPYHSVNPAIRSRCQVYRLNDLNENDMLIVLKRAKKAIAEELDIDEEVYDLLIKRANFEIRTLINAFETLVTTRNSDHITKEDAIRVCGMASVAFDANGDSYYDTLSGLQKSIRGSDVDATMHYLAKLIIANDLESLCRRLLVIAYEDIGLANPGIGPKVKSACDAARELGFPEARIPLSVVAVEMALSPKSNSAYTALDKALHDLENGKTGTLPKHLKNTYSFDPSQKSYLYPHDYPNAWVDQQYLPDALVGVKYYNPLPTSKFETALYQRYMQIESWKTEAKKKKLK